MGLGVLLRDVCIIVEGAGPVASSVPPPHFRVGDDHEMLSRGLNAHRLPHLTQEQTTNFRNLGRLILHLDPRPTDAPPSALVLVRLPRSRHPDRRSQTPRPCPHRTRIGAVPPLLRPVSPNRPAPVPSLHGALCGAFGCCSHCPPRACPPSHCAVAAEALGPRPYGGQL